jgi:outer membrane protein assembly factor BamB
MNMPVTLDKSGHRRRPVPALALAGSLLLSAVTPAMAADWSHWRGPNYNGSTDETGLPDSWSKTENVAWVTPLPGASAATPVIHVDHVFLSSTDTANDTLLAMALDRVTGKELWRREIGKGISRDRMSTYAACSPVTDGERVVYFYGNGKTAVFDFAGEKVWERDLAEEYGEFAFGWTFAASPLIEDGRLIYQVLQRDVPVRGRGPAGGHIESYLLAVDPATGKNLWKTVRPSEAKAESREAFTSPIPFEGAGRKEILVAGGDCLTGHDAATGKELWRWGTWNPNRIGHWRLVPSPVAGGGVILVCAPKREPVFAIKAGPNGTLETDDTAWDTYEERDLTSDVPTPLFYQGDFFILSDLRKTLARVDPATGKPKWTVPTPGRAKYEASPTGADGRIFLMNFAGEVVTVDPKDGTILRVIPMGEEGDDKTRSSIAVAHGQIFIRTNGHLYCVAKP